MKLAAILLIAAAAAQAQTATQLSLSQAVDEGLQNQPLLRSARLGVDLAEKRIGEARAGRMPSVNLSQTLTRGNNPVFVFGSLLEQGRFGPQNFSLPALNNPAPVTNVRTALSASVPAFDGLKTSLHVAEAKIRRDDAVLQRIGIEQRVRFDVLNRYFDVVAAEANREAANEAVRMAESDLKRATDRVDAGLAVASDRLAANVQLSEFTQQQIDAEGNLEAALVALNVAIGSSAQTHYELTARLQRKRFEVLRQDELIQRAKLHRADYLQADSGIQLAERQISERRSDYLPGIQIFGSFGNSGSNWSSGSTDYAIGAGITINLLSPGRTSRLGEAHLEHDLARTERDRIGDQIVVEVARAYQQYRSAAQRVEVAEAALSQADEALRMIRDRYEAGLTTVVDLLRAESTLVRARTSVTTAKEGVYVGYASILLVTGELDDVYEFES